MTPTDFTPFSSYLSGALIGLATVLLMALHGRIMGATGIVAGLMRFGDGSDWRVRLSLLAGMVLAPAALRLATGEGPDIQVPVSWAALVLGGLIVGIGTAYGGGCTSGHGVCGLARLSRRSIVATASFMLAAFVTVFVTRHLLGI